MTNPKPHPSEAIERVEKIVADRRDAVDHLQVYVYLGDARSLLSALGVAAARVRDIGGQRDRARTNERYAEAERDAALSEATSWRERAERAEGALKPFATAAEGPSCNDDTMRIAWEMGIGSDGIRREVRPEHFRLARSVLSPVGGGASIDSAVAESAARNSGSPEASEVAGKYPSAAEYVAVIASLLEVDDDDVSMTNAEVRARLDRAREIVARAPSPWDLNDAETWCVIAGRCIDALDELSSWSEEDGVFADHQALVGQMERRAEDAADEARRSYPVVKGEAVGAQEGEGQ